MGVEKFIERLGAPHDKAWEILIPADKLPLVAPPRKKRRRKTHNPTSTLVRDEKGEEATQATVESIVAPPPPNETKKVTDGEEEAVEKYEAAEHAETETTQCPKCEADVGWNNLEVQKVYSASPSFFPPLDLFFADEVTLFKECPICHFKQEIQKVLIEDKSKGKKEGPIWPFSLFIE